MEEAIQVYWELTGKRITKEPNPMHLMMMVHNTLEEEAGASKDIYMTELTQPDKDFDLDAVFDSITAGPACDPNDLESCETCQ